MTPSRTRILAASAALLAAASLAPARAQELTEDRRIEVAERLQESSVAIRAGMAGGSGFVVGVGPERWVVTNAHVVQGFRRSRVVLHFGDGTELEGHVIAYDPARDLAIVEPMGELRVRPLPLADSNQVRVGQTVLAFGSPFGLDGTLTQGIVSARRDLPAIGGGDLHQLIQTDATINPGNSGGPLVNGRGEVVGVNTAILSRSGGSQGIGFAVPSNYVRELIEATVADRERRARAARERPSPAAGTAEVTTERAGPTNRAPEAPARPSTPVWIGIYGGDFAGGGVAGVQVRRVIPGGPAATAGLLGSGDPAPPYVRQLGIPWTGHIILAVDGQPVRTMDDLQAALRQRRPGDSATLFLTVGPGVVSGEAVIRLAPPPPR